MSSSRFLQRSFVEPFAIELDFVCALIEAAIGFTTQTDHFSARNSSLNDPGSRLSRLICLEQQVRGKKLLLESAAKVLLQSFILMFFQTSLMSGLIQSSSES